MYLLSKMGIFHCYVSLPEGKVLDPMKPIENEKKAPGCFACIQGENLSFVIGFIISHYRNSY